MKRNIDEHMNGDGLKITQLEKSRKALTSRMGQIEHRILGLEDQVEEADHTS